MAAAAQANRSASAAARPRSRACDQPAAEHVARPGRVDRVHAEGRHAVDRVPFDRDGSLRPERDADQPDVLPPKRPQRLLMIPGAGQFQRDVVGQDRHARKLQQIDGPLGHPIDVARDGNPGVAGQPRRGDGSLIVDVIHVHEPRRSDRGERQRFRRQDKALITMPDDQSIAAVIDQDDRRGGLTVADDEVGRVHAVAGERVLDHPPPPVTPNDAHILRAQAETAARGQRCRSLAPAADLVGSHPDLREGRTGLGKGRNPVDVVDATRAHTDDIPAGGGAGKLVNRCAHWVLMESPGRRPRCICTSTEGRLGVVRQVIGRRRSDPISGRGRRAAPCSRAAPRPPPPSGWRGSLRRRPPCDSASSG